MNTAPSVERKIWTEADLQALPEEGFLHEVVDGELVMSPKNDFYHGHICARLSAALYAFAVERRLGVVLDSSTGFWMENRNCRAPDISFITKDRLVRLGFEPSTRKFFPGAPDLAVEILSPNNTRTEIDGRLQDFFTSGAQIAWIIDPDAKRTEICRAIDKRTLVGVGGFLEAEPLLPGFRYPLADLFKKWDWD
jgi:Uma2 family endonuclease